jgi:hypothetical protein
LANAILSKIVDLTVDNNNSTYLFNPDITIQLYVFLWLLFTSIFCKIIFQSKKVSVFPTAWFTFTSAGYKTQEPCRSELWCFLTKQETSTIKL